MTIGERLTYYIEKQGFKKKEFCEIFSFEYNNLIGVMANKRPLGIKILNQLHEALPRMNVHWLLYEEGSVEIYSEKNSYLVNEPKEKYDEINDDNFKEKLLNYLEKEEVINKINKIVDEAKSK